VNDFLWSGPDSPSTLYTGVTSALLKRVWEHRNNSVEGFTRKYSVHTLVWYELHETMHSAIQREKAIKNWKRAWKNSLHSWKGYSVIS